MPVILVIGPSHAGKSTLVASVVKEQLRSELPNGLMSINLDEALGSAHRSNGAKTRGIITNYSRKPEVVLVDCGAGQVSFSSLFRDYVTSNMRAVLAVWCDEQTFLARHDSPRVESGVANNYKSELVTLWNAARTHGHIVDTSGRVSAVQSAAAMAQILVEMIADQSWIAG